MRVQVRTPERCGRPRTPGGGRRSILGLLAFGALALGFAFEEDVWAKQAEKDDRAVVTMAGLRLHDDGSSTLYVELTRPVPVDVEGTGKDLVFNLRGARVPFRNNENPLLAQHLASVVRSARLVAGKRDVALVVELRQVAKPRHEMVNRPGGAATLKIDFPPAAS